MGFKRYLQVQKYPGFLKRKIKLSQREKVSKKDRLKLEKKIPMLQNYPKLSNEVREKLQPYYDEYVTKISRDDMTISMELAVFLRIICDITKPKKILDLGSGFSSFVFRQYKSESNPKLKIWSIDDSSEWLDETRKYLKANKLPNENVLSWDDFKNNKNNNFDLILHDFGSMDVRKEVLPEVLKLSKPGGLVVLDDAHFDYYFDYAKEVLKGEDLENYSLDSYTKDKFGRYSLLVTL